MWRAIELVYEEEVSPYVWVRHVLVTSDGKEYERLVNMIHQSYRYRVVSVRHV